MCRQCGAKFGTIAPTAKSAARRSRNGAVPSRRTGAVRRIQQ